MTTTERKLTTACIGLAAAFMAVLAIKAAQTRPVVKRAPLNTAAQETCAQVLVLWYHRRPESADPAAGLRDLLVVGRAAQDIPPTVAPDVRAAVGQLFDARSLLTFSEKVEQAREACRAYREGR